MTTPVITSFRQALASALETALGIDFIPGYLEGPALEGSDIGCVFPAGVVEREENVQQELLTVFVRVFKTFDRSEDPLTPIDPAGIEEAGQQIQEAVDDAAVGLGGTWFCRVTALEFDASRNAVEATVQAWSDNRFAVA